MYKARLIMGALLIMLCCGQIGGIATFILTRISEGGVLKDAFAHLWYQEYAARWIAMLMTFGIGYKMAYPPTKLLNVETRGHLRSLIFSFLALCEGGDEREVRHLVARIVDTIDLQAIFSFEMERVVDEIIPSKWMKQFNRFMGQEVKERRSHWSRKSLGLDGRGYLIQRYPSE